MKLRENQFQYFLDLYGSDVSRWPPRQARAAQQLLNGSAKARQQLQQMRELESRLDQWTVTPPGPLAVAPILAYVRQSGKTQDALIRWRDRCSVRSLWPSIAVGLSAVLGAIAGLVEADSVAVLLEAPDLMTLAHTPDLHLLLGLL
jgi:hypothetical protein